MQWYDNLMTELTTKQSTRRCSAVLLTTFSQTDTSLVRMGRGVRSIMISGPRVQAILAMGILGTDYFFVPSIMAEASVDNGWVTDVENAIGSPEGANLVH